MANTYFKIEKEHTEEPTMSLDGVRMYTGYTNKYRLTLTAFMGKSERLQLTIQTTSTLESQNGVAYITLSDEEIELLYLGMKERKDISATGNEQSKYSPAD